MQPEQDDDAFDIVTRPPISTIPHFIKSPPPPAFPKLLSTFSSTVPTDTRIPRQPLPLDVSLKVAVSSSLYFRVVPRLYPGLPTRNPTLDDLLDKTYILIISNTPANRSLVHHALYGILNHSLSHPPSVFSRVLTANLHALSTIANRLQTFAISLEPSPYFGVAGLEARIVFSPLTSPTTSPPSYHLLAISAPEVHIPNLECLLREICPQFRHRLLGVVANLTPEQHNAPMGVTASRVIAHFMRLAPRGPFVTPDMTLTPPPLTPAKLAAFTKEEMTELVNQYRPRLEHNWTSEIFDRIMQESEQLRESRKAPQTRGEDMLEHAWVLVGDQYPNLRKFVAVLATGYAYKPPIRAKVPITCQDSTNPMLAAEFVLQARQFALLRKAIDI